MGRKKTKQEDPMTTSSDEQEHHESCSDETLGRLFSKKYIYSRNDEWSLKSTSVFSPLMQKYPTGSAITGEGVTKTGVEDCKQNQPISSTQSDVRHDSAKDWTSSTHRFHAVDHGVRTSPQSSPQIKSPRFLDGPQPSKFRRRMAPTRRPSPKMKVTLPSPWQYETLIAEKDKLNALKDKLSDKEMIAWHQHTNSTNLAGRVVGEVKSRYGAELCTQAWCKFHEILASHDVVPPSVLAPGGPKLNSVHLCEAPGAFITSLNHYLVSRGVDTRQRWEWLGTTLNPYYEGNDTGRMISDDRFIRTTRPNWFFGRDNSGDLMSVDNMVALMDRARRMGDVHLVTADGSIDCQKNPAEQERIVSRLHLCEVLCSCLLLAPGGTLVIKLFTMFEASSIGLLYFLNCVFQQVCVCKPATSKSGNSEVYAVCSGYTAALSHDALLSVFAAVCSPTGHHDDDDDDKNDDTADVVLLRQEDIPASFLQAHEACCLYFCQLQSLTIAHNLELYRAMDDAERGRIDRLQEMCVQRYVRLCCLREIDNEDRIVPYGVRSVFTRFSSRLSSQDSNRRSAAAAPSFLPPTSKVMGVGSSSVSLSLNRIQGTFHQRQQQNRSPWQQQLEQMLDYSVEEQAGQKIKRRQKISEEVAQKWKVVHGGHFGSVASSQFVDSRLVADLQAMFQHAQVTLHQEKALARHSTSILKHALHLLPHHHHHHHHHSPSSPTYSPYLPTFTTTTTTPVFHLPLEGSLTEFWPPDSPELRPLAVRRRLSSVEGLAVALDRAEVSAEGGGVGAGVGVVVDLTCPRRLGREEVEGLRRLVEVVLTICSYLPSDSSMVLIMPLALTRLSAGLLYILATLFQETSFASSGAHSPFLHQTLCFQHFSAPSYTLLTLLETLRRDLSPPPPPRPTPTLRLSFTEPPPPPPPPSPAHRCGCGDNGDAIMTAKGCGLVQSPPLSVSGSVAGRRVKGQGSLPEVTTSVSAVVEGGVGICESCDKSCDKSVNKSVDKLHDKSSDRSCDRSSDKSGDRSCGKCGGDVINSCSAKRQDGFSSATATTTTTSTAATTADLNKKGACSHCLVLNCREMSDCMVRRAEAERNGPSSDMKRAAVVDMNRPSTDINRPSTDMNRPSTDINRPSTDMNRPSTDMNRSASEVQNFVGHSQDRAVDAPTVCTRQDMHSVTPPTDREACPQDVDMTTTRDTADPLDQPVTKAVTSTDDGDSAPHDMSMSEPQDPHTFTPSSTPFDSNNNDDDAHTSHEMEVTTPSDERVSLTLLSGATPAPYTPQSPCRYTTDAPSGDRRDDLSVADSSRQQRNNPKSVPMPLPQNSVLGGQGRGSSSTGPVDGFKNCGHGRWRRRGRGGGGGGGAEGSMVDDRCSVAVGGSGVRKMVPVEIVPVLDLLNDVTFTRFLHASNGHSISRFLAAIKAAEQQRLAGQRNTP
ncbi:uncharacterized protein LOC143276151 isoform X2 [Babylonia areolata]|uniref:uncharacterized protein LOC143276151 isoform X2 n=1 Tax=Babylonia areolata TaxID=304850 RepID=UPI003FD6AF11